MTNAIYKSYLQKNPSVKDRLALGKSIRKQVNRSSLADYKIQNKRQTGVDIVLKQEESRIPSYIPIRHARMAANPFAFFRGGAAIMAHDLSSTPTTRITVQLCGDMHVSNFGFFSTTEHQLVFGINDFDETLVGSFDWDLKRLAASAMIASEDLGQDRIYGESIVRQISMSYRHYLQEYAHTAYSKLIQTYIDEKSLKAQIHQFDPKNLSFIKKHTAKARANTNIGVIGKLTKDTPQGQRLIDNPPLIEHLELSIHGRKIIDLLDEVLSTYTQSLLPDRSNLLSRYKIKDWARKIVGIGSVGLSCWIIYLEGLNAEDPIFLQVKKAQKSVLEPYFSENHFTCQGDRVVSGQRLIQGAPDFFLGYGSTAEGDFYVRQLRDMKGGITIGKGGVGVAELPDLAKLFGWALANAHARSGDPAILAGYCGKGEALDDALVKFSLAYSQQNEVDYDAFMTLIKSNKISCATENY